MSGVSDRANATDNLSGMGHFIFSQMFNLVPALFELAQIIAPWGEGPLGSLMQ